MSRRIINSGFKSWTPDQLPNLAGKIYVITGANSGIGYEAAKYLGDAGAADLLIKASRQKIALLKQ